MTDTLPLVPALAPAALPALAKRPARFAPRRDPGALDRPAFLMSDPFSDPTRIADHASTRDLERERSRKRAYLQFVELYRHLSAEAVVYLLPTVVPCAPRDPVLAGHMGVVLEHLPGRNPVVLSNLGTDAGGPSQAGRGFFEAMGYETRVAPLRFGGEADLAHLRDDLYLAGYGIRSELECYDWMESTYDMRVIKVALQDPALDHLGCTFFPLTCEHALVCTSLFEPREIREIERHVSIIDVTLDECYSGICNNVRLSGGILNASHLDDLGPGTESYEWERAKNRRLRDIGAGLGLGVAHFNLSECLAGGTPVSCMVMHLNRHAYRVAPAT